MCEGMCVSWLYIRSSKIPALPDRGHELQEHPLLDIISIKGIRVTFEFVRLLPILLIEVLGKNRMSFAAEGGEVR